MKINGGLVGKNTREIQGSRSRKRSCSIAEVSLAFINKNSFGSKEKRKNNRKVSNKGIVFSN